MSGLLRRRQIIRPGDLLAGDGHRHPAGLVVESVGGGLVRGTGYFPGGRRFLEGAVPLDWAEGLGAVRRDLRRGRLRRIAPDGRSLGEQAAELARGV